MKKGTFMFCFTKTYIHGLKRKENHIGKQQQVCQVFSQIGAGKEPTLASREARCPTEVKPHC